MLRELFARERETLRDVRVGPCEPIPFLCPAPISACLEGDPPARTRRRASDRAAARPDGHPPQRRPGLAPPDPRGYRLIAYDARGHGSSAPAPAATSTPTWSPTWRPCSTHLELERGGAGRQLDGRRHRDGLHARAPGARARAGADHPRLHGLRAHRRRGRLHLGASWPTRSSAAASTPSSRWPSPTTCPSKWREIAREATRQRMERHRDPRRWRRRCARCRARSPGRASSRSRTSTCRRWSSARATRPTACTRSASPRSTRRKLPDAELAGRGRGQVAARLAGRAAVGRDRGLPRADRLSRRRRGRVPRRTIVAPSCTATS